MSDSIKLADLDPDDLLAELRSRAAGEGAVSSAAADARPDLSEYDDATLLAAAKSGQKVIYGVDNRADVFTLPAGADRDDADSVVALFEDSAVTDNGNGTSTLSTDNFGAAYKLCSGERFRDQPVGPFCSGVLVAPDTIATAGHCINAGNVTTIRFVFGFRMSDATTIVTTVPNSEIYRGVSLLGRQEVGDGPDWALVRIDRPVSNHPVGKLRRTGKIADNQPLHVIGHPCGLPTKFAGDAAVRNNTSSAFFVANLDTYGGNSGSPVFSSTTHEVEGILVRGETDFVQMGNCSVSMVCPTSGCRGEDSTRVSQFAKLVAPTSIWPNGKAYFFKGSEYCRYDAATDKVDSGWPKPIAGNWTGFPATFAAGVNAAVLWTNGKAYFFQGSQYIRFDLVSDSVDVGPTAISASWSGLTGPIDATVVWNNGKAYFFQGSQYLRYDLAADKVDTGWPKPIAGNWTGFPAGFTTGVDAAVLWNNGKAYFFKGSQYIRFDLASDSVDAGPTAISTGWPGLFTSGIDA